MSLLRSLSLSSIFFALAMAGATGANLEAQEASAEQPEAGDVAAEEAPAEDATADVQDGLEGPASDARDSADAVESPFYALYGTAAAYLESQKLGRSELPGGALERDGYLSDEAFVYALRILYQFGRIADDRLAAWARREGHGPVVDPVVLPPLAAVAWSGRVTKVEVVEVPEDLYLDMSRAYVLHVRSDGDPPIEWRILVDRAPQAWLKGAPDAEASGYAVVLPTSSAAKGAVSWAVGGSPTWRPSEPNEALGVTPARAALAESGLNLLELDGLRERDKAELDAADWEAFFAMLRATQTLSDAERAKLVQDVTLVDLLTNAERYVGEAVRFPARVRRITQIRVDDSRAVRLLGRETYWQLDCVYDLDDQPIRMRGRQGEDIVFNSTFPATVCTLDLPPELEEERKRSLERGGGGEVNRQTIVEGFFFRLWAFPTEQTRAAGGDALQFGPLTIGAIQTVQPPEYDGSWTYWLLIPAGLALCGLMIFLWRSTRGDSLNERIRTARMDRNAGDIDRLKGIETRGKPDFTNYAKHDRPGPKPE
ncbi:MAG TPA: hypothetical protein VGN57_01215 [Pirellulaceae bacterium]|jgi:hypothetical protein|nr:hypothetical protein [Pirellulaceae bacterium]